MSGCDGKKPFIVLLHGYNSDGEYIRKLQPYYERAGWDVYPYIYGKRAWGAFGNLIANRFRTKDIVNGLINFCRGLEHRRIYFHGHSHAGLLTYLVEQECPNVRGVTLFNAALERGFIFNHAWVVNGYVPTDKVLTVGAKFRPFSDWGDYGAHPSDFAQVNLNLTKFGVSGHSDVMKKLNTVMPAVMAHQRIQMSLERKYG